MGQLLFERANHRVEREEGLLHLRVWRDPQLAAESAAIAFELTVRALAPMIATFEQDPRSRHPRASMRLYFR